MKGCTIIRAFQLIRPGVRQLMCRTPNVRLATGLGRRSVRRAAGKYAALRRISLGHGGPPRFGHEGIEVVEVKGLLEVFKGSEALGFLLRAILLEGGHHNDGAF